MPSRRRSAWPSSARSCSHWRPGSRRLRRQRHRPVRTCGPGHCLLGGGGGQSIDQIGEYLGLGPRAFCSPASGTCPSCFIDIRLARRADVRRTVGLGRLGPGQRPARTGGGLPERRGEVRDPDLPPRGSPHACYFVTLAVGGMLVPTLAVHLETPAARHAHALSDATAIILLLVYVASVPFWLGGGPTRNRSPGRLLVPDPRPQEPSGARPRNHRRGQAVAARHGGHGACGCRSRIRPSSPTGSVRPWSRPRPPLGSRRSSRVWSSSLSLERGRELRRRPLRLESPCPTAVSAILSSPLQIALLLTPVLVLGSAFFGNRQLTLVFPPLLVAAWPLRWSLRPLSSI